MNGATPQSAPIVPRTDDVAFQSPQDPLKDRGATRNRARLIHREIPNVVVEQGWTIAGVRSALQDLVVGLFDKPTQLQDAIASDSRVQSAMKSLSGGLLGQPLTFKVPDRFKDDKRAKKCLRAWERHWPQMEAESALLDLVETSSSLGFSTSQLLWDTSGSVWKPYLQTFSSRYTYYQWMDRCHMAVTLDGQLPITPGDGHWVLHAPYGGYRGWMRGSLRAVAQWWLARNYALRDWARYCERHGFPLIVGDTPFGADPQDIEAFAAVLSEIGQESVLQAPGSVDVAKYGRYDVRYVEPKDDTWQSFKALIDQCNDEITLALMGQNLTSQVKEGSLAAARVHADVRQNILEGIARSLSRTLYTQVIRPFAVLNFGDADLAPLAKWDVSPPEDQDTKAKTLVAFSQALNYLRTAGYKLENPEPYSKRFGLFGMKLTTVDPVQIEAQLARATGALSADPTPAPDPDESDDDDDKDEDKDKDDGAKAMAQHDKLLASFARPKMLARDRQALMHASDGLMAAAGRYVWTASDDACDVCQDRDGKAYSTYDNVPETHPNCNCTVEYVATVSKGQKAPKKKLPKPHDRKPPPVHAKDKKKSKKKRKAKS